MIADSRDGLGLLRLLLASCEKDDVIASLSLGGVPNQEGHDAWNSLHSASLKLPKLSYFPFDEASVLADSAVLQFMRNEYDERPSARSRDALFAYIALWHTALGYRYSENWSAELAFLVWAAAKMGHVALIELLHAIRFLQSKSADHPSTSLQFEIGLSCTCRALQVEYWAQAERSRQIACGADLETFEHKGITEESGRAWERVLISIPMKVSQDEMLRFLHKPR